MPRSNWRAGATAAALALAAALAACGGSDDAKDANVRFLNATVDVGSLSMYTGDDRRVADVPADSLSDYVPLKAEGYDFKFKRSGSDSSVLTSSGTLSEETPHTVIAWGREGQIRMAIVEDDQDQPSAGLVKIRVLNAATDAGPVDLYVGDASTDFDGVSASSSSVAVGSFSGFTERSAGTLKIRITSAGNRDELRLEIPSLETEGRQVITLVLQPTAGGVLVHALSLVQQGKVSAQKNQQSRVRLVASVAGNGVVASRVGTTVLSNAATSPNIGSYVLVPSGTRTLLAQVGGSTVSSESLGFVAGQDYTVLVHGDPASSSVVRVSDDNRAAASGRAKIRLVHGVPAYDTLTMTVDSASVANDLAYGSISSFVSVASNVGNALIEVTSPLATTPLYTTSRSNSSTTGVSLDGTGVYTLFMLSGSSSPRGFLRRDR
jgi:Domain of unknown function (DUF4397)